MIDPGRGVVSSAGGRMTEQDLSKDCLDRRLRETAGISAVSFDMIDQAYLDHWASEIGVVELLERAIGMSSADG